MNSELEYLKLQEELRKIESETGVYLADQNIDHENVEPTGFARGSDEYYQSMICAAGMAAGMRAEEAGLDLTKLIGRPVY